MLSSLSLLDVFFWVGVVSTALFLIKLLIFLFTGLGSELSFDFNSIAEVDTSFNFLSLESILAFFMGFGWIGAAFCGPFKMPIWMCIFAAIVFGLMFACLYAFSMLSIKKLDQNSIVNYEDCVGSEGKAYTTIIPHREGKAELTINDKLRIVDVINDTDEEIASFTLIKVVRYENEKLYVERV